MNSDFDRIRKMYISIYGWVGAGFIYLQFLAIMVGETRPYSHLIYISIYGWVGAGFIYLQFLAIMVGETCPYSHLITND